MTFPERREAFEKELKELGEKYKIALLGTCEHEGILGEITIVDLEDMPGCRWRISESDLWNFA